VLETKNVTRPKADANDRQVAEYVRLRVCDLDNAASSLSRYWGLGKGAEEAHATIPGLQEVFEGAEQCGGWIEWHSDPKLGPWFVLCMPGARATTRVPPLPVVPTLQLPPAACVLLVDDEPMVRQLGRDILEKGGHRVL